MKRRAADPGTLLARALVAHARTSHVAVGAELLSARRWASATFDGERVRIGVTGTNTGATWIAELPEAELRVRGHLVAEIQAIAAGAECLTVEALLIRDA